MNISERRQMQKEIAEKKGKKGFAALSPERKREIASMGGKAAHASGNAHQFDSEEAGRAGKLGGIKVSQNKEHMSAIGRKGGASRKKKTESLPS